MIEAAKAVLDSTSPAMSRALGERLGRLLAPGDCVQLVGVLGAGKTTFTKGLALGLGLDPDEVTSPSFTLVQVYRRPDGVELVHVDGFRLGSPGDAETLGLEEFPAGILVVEWGERLEAWLPEDRLRLDLRDEGAPDSGPPDPGGVEHRRIEVRASGPRSRALLDAWKAGIERDPVGN